MSEEKQEGKRAPARRKKLIPVTVIAKTGKGAVVQWLEKNDLKRVTIPRNKLEGDKVDAEILKAGVPYGLPWEELLLPEVTAKDLAKELRRHNVWTATDAQLNAVQVRAAVQSVYKQTVLAIVEFSRQSEVK